MKLSRRGFVAGSMSAAAMAHAPGHANAPVSDLRIAAPDLLATTPPAGTIIASGDALMTAMLPRLGQWQSLEAVLGEADMQMLAELVRFAPGLRWEAEPLPAGSETFAGPLRRKAYAIRATRG